MEKVKIRKISLGEAWELPWVSWNLAKKHYSHALWIGLIIILCNVIIQIPLAGPAINAFLLIYLTCGILTICRQWENKKEPEFSQLFIAFNDNVLFSRLLPLAIFNVILCVLLYFFTQLTGQLYGESSFTNLFIVLISSNIQGAFTYFTTALLFFNKNLNLQEAIQTSIKVYIKNYLPMFFAGILIIFIAGFSAILLLFPFIFFFIPLSVPYNYYIYRATCEDLVLNSEDKSKEISSS